MDITSMQIKIKDFLKKYKFVAIILLVGIALMLIPIKTETKTEKISNPVSSVQEVSANKALEEILSQIEGAGKVRVLLTEASSEETVYQSDQKINQSEENSNTQSDTVTLTDSNRNEYGLIKQTVSPVYRGAIVVCEGADSASVRYAIAQAVSKVTGLSTDRISVLKMK